jgi:hypothetical protein
LTDPKLTSSASERGCVTRRSALAGSSLPATGDRVEKTVVPQVSVFSGLIRVSPRSRLDDAELAVLESALDNVTVDCPFG